MEALINPVKFNIGKIIKRTERVRFQKGELKCVETQLFNGGDACGGSSALIALLLHSYLQRQNQERTIV